MARNRLTVFDTTLGDGEQAPGFSMRIHERVRLARQLDALGVDIIEAGFPIASEADAEAVKAVAAAVRRPDRDGIGARVTVRTGVLPQAREVKRTLGIYSASDPRVHFGLGEETVADLVRVEWPSGKVDEFRGVAADRHYRVDEAEGLKPEPPRRR